MLILPFPSFYLIIVLLSTRRTTSLVLESIDRFGFCRFFLSHPLVLVLSDIPTSNHLCGALLLKYVRVDSEMNIHPTSASVENVQE